MFAACFLDEVQDEESHYAKMQTYKHLLGSLSNVNYETLRCVIKHLHQFVIFLCLSCKKCFCETYLQQF